jgi:hypothetical protein
MKGKIKKPRLGQRDKGMREESEGKKGKTHVLPSALCTPRTILSCARPRADTIPRRPRR